MALSEGENPDGSFTITKPVMYRGNKKYQFSSYHTNTNGLCRAMGFEKELPGYVTSFNTETKEKVL